MITETFLCNQKEDTGQEPSSQNENPVTDFLVSFFKQLGTQIFDDWPSGNMGCLFSIQSILLY